VAASNRACNVRVFGSVARGEATPDSDIDFLVEFEPGASLMDVSGLHLDLEASSGVRSTWPSFPWSQRWSGSGG